MNEIEAKVQIMIYIVGIPIAFHLMNLQKTCYLQRQVKLFTMQPDNFQLLITFKIIFKI